MAIDFIKKNGLEFTRSKSVILQYITAFRNVLSNQSMLGNFLTNDCE